MKTVLHRILRIFNKFLFRRKREKKQEKIFVVNYEDEQKQEEEEKKEIIKRKKIVYLSGKITGTDKLERMMKFEESERRFTKMNYDVINPEKIFRDSKLEYIEILKKCIALLTTADYIYMLEDWQNSKGAKIELEVANKLQIFIIYRRIIKL